MTEYYRALDMLMKQYAPTLKGRQPFWKPKAAPVDVHLPAWQWTSPEPIVQGEQLVDADVCGAYLAACSSAPFAHGALEHTGPDADGPGYYLVDAHIWQESRIVSPLGTNEITTHRVWVAYPTLRLLRSLAEHEFAYWPDVAVYDSWTSATSCRMRKWTDAVQADRLEALEAIDVDPEGQAALDRYKLIKNGYSMAVQMMKGPAEGGEVKADIRRPDWYHTVHAQHAANTWRKAFNALTAGYPPVAMGSVDEITWTLRDFNSMMQRSVPVFRVDPSGAALGALKLKHVHAHA